MATNKQQVLDPYQDIEAYLARAQKEIGDAFDDIVMVAAREVQGGKNGGKEHHGRATLNFTSTTTTTTEIINHQNKDDTNDEEKDKHTESPCSSCKNVDQKFETFKSMKLSSNVYVSSSFQPPPPPPPRFHSLMLDNRIKLYREELQFRTNNRRSVSRSFRNMSCPARQRFLDDLTNSLVRNKNRTASDSEEPSSKWKSKRRSSLPLPSNEFPVEKCNQLGDFNNYYFGSLDRQSPYIRQRVVLNGMCYDDFNTAETTTNVLGDETSHLSSTEVGFNSILEPNISGNGGKHMSTLLNTRYNQHAMIPNDVDFDSITAFIDSVVEEVNSLNVDGELQDKDKEDLTKLASHFPTAKLRKEKLWVSRKMSDSEPDYESIDETNDDVFEEELVIKDGERIDKLNASLFPSPQKLTETISIENPVTFEEENLVSNDFEQFVSLPDNDNFIKIALSKDLKVGISDGNENNHQHQKPCDLGEFLKQVENSIRETNGATSPSFLSAESNENSIDDLTDAATQTTPPYLSRSTSFTWFCDCHCINSDCKHRQSVIWEEGREFLDASVNDMLSAIGDGAASVEELMKLDGSIGHLDGIKELSINECEADFSSSSYSLSASLDNVSAGSSSEAEDEEEESISLASTFDSASSPEENRALKLSSLGELINQSNQNVVIRRNKPDPRLITSLTDEEKSQLCLRSCVDVGTSPLNTLSYPQIKPRYKSKKTKPSVCFENEKNLGSSNNSSKKSDLVADGRLSYSLDQMTEKCQNNSADKITGFSTVPLPKPKVAPLSCNKTSEVKSEEIMNYVSGIDNDCFAENTATVLKWDANHSDWLNSNKSFSAPILGCNNKFVNNTDNNNAERVGKTSLSEPGESKELEAVEACKWLRAAGFPQYAQMFEDMQFPIDVSAVQKDHYFLDHDSLQSLFRRLNALNRCARMRLENLPRKINGDDSDEENQCALSENWKFQRQSRRWSRIPGNFEAVLSSRNSNKDEWYSNVTEGEEGGVIENNHDHENANNNNKFHLPVLEVAISGDGPVPMEEDGGSSSASPPASEKCDNNNVGSPLKRSGSERLKDGAKALLRRVESLKSRRSRRKNREVVVISGPQLLDVPGKDDGESYTCLQITPPDTPALRLYTSPTTGESSSPSPNSPQETSPSSSGRPAVGAGRKKGRRFFGGRYRGDDSYALSDSECSPTLWRSGPPSPTGVTKCYIENFLAPDSPQHLGTDNEANNGINYRTGSFNLGVESSAYRERFKDAHKNGRGNKRDSSDLEPDRQSVYDNVPVVIFNRGYQEDTLKPAYQSLPNSSALSVEHKGDDSSTNEFASSNEVDSGSATSTVHDASDREGRSPTQSHLERRDSGVGLSLTRSDRSQSIWQTSIKCHRPSIPCRSVPLNELSNGQIMVIRKLALLKLTSLMERYSPSNRSGWNWAMPKFIKRMKTPEYKDKMVFGVPLVVVLQRTGQALPPSIQTSIRHIRKSAMDSVGIFRKSGVRSRIQKLKNLHETHPSNVVYDDLQPYDVADLLKQYFRELPEALLTNKMSETFISIYQHVAEEARLEALQAAVILLPDENREVLQALLSFLNDVAGRSKENQMTASNLAVCFAPSLFHMNCPRSQSTSPRRRKTVGVPDQRELSENRAAHECLTQMICDFNLLFSIPDDLLAQVRCPYMDQWQPPSMEQILQVGGNDNWKAGVEADIQWLLKESKEKFKSWVQVNTSDGTDLSYKKVGDGNPLRIWKVAVEIEAPPTELLNSLLRERHLWDNDILKWRVIERLNKQTEVFQYVCNSMSPLPARDYCILRSWKTDLPKGTCVLIESSVTHPDASPLLGGVRGVVLTSRYLIEPCGSGKSRLTHVSRIDTRGRSPEWYNKVYGQICCLHVTRLRDSLHHSAEGPESKV